MRVYLSAPQAADISVLRNVLADLGAEVVPPIDGDGLRWQTLDSWDGVDAAVVVLMALDRRDNDRVMVEAGVALGRHVPLLVFSEHGVPSELFKLARVAEVPSLLNPDALQFHLSLFLKGLSVGAEQHGRGPQDSSHGVNVEPFRSSLASIRKVPPEDSGPLYERWVADLFRAAGAEVVAPGDRANRGFDFVVAVPDLDLRTGPLVVEVKRSSSPRVLTSAALELQYLVLQERAGLGLLLYEDDDLPQSFVLQVVPMVVSLGIGELVRELEREPLADVLARATNDAVNRL